MKYILFIAVILLCTLNTVYSDDESYSVQQNAMIRDQQDYTNIADIKKAIKCGKLAMPQLWNLLQTYYDLTHFKLFSLFKDGFEMIKGLFKIPEIIDNCKVLFCYKPSLKKCQKQYGRPCEVDGLYAYETCKEGYKSDGSKCKLACPSGFANRPFGNCKRPKGYMNGWGYPIWDQKKCERKHNTECVKIGLLYYPKCRDGYFNYINQCKVKCPQGFKDGLIYCKRDKSSTYSREQQRVPITIGAKCVTSFFANEDFDQEQCHEQKDNFITLRNFVLEEFQNIVEHEKVEYMNQDFKIMFQESIDRYYAFKRNCPQEFQEVVDQESQ